MERESIKFWSDIASTWVTIIGAGGAAVFALIQYSEKNESDRSQASFEYVDRYNGEAMLKLRTLFAGAWEAQSAKLLTMNEATLTPHVLSVVKKNKLEQPIELMSDFYQGVHTCICSHICEADTAVKFLGKPAFDFWGMHGAYIISQRRTLNDVAFGEGVEALGWAYHHQIKIQCGRESLATAAASASMPAPGKN